MQEYGHTLFETLLKDEENQYCFDCGKNHPYLREKTCTLGFNK